jgi:branched-chain amino acid aminotransferase
MTREAGGEGGPAGVSEQVPPESSSLGPAGVRMPASVDGTLCDAATATIPLYDDGLLRGDGAFEYILCYRGRPFTLGEHLDRLERTCRTLRLACPRDLLVADIERLFAWAGTVTAGLRIVLTRGGRRIVFLEPRPASLPVRLAFVTDVPRLVLDGSKSLAYAGNMLARRLAEERGFQEALLTTPDGRVMEVQQASFFWVTAQGELCTPPLSEGILDSITRRVVMRALPVHERVCRTEDALAAAEAFLGGAGREVQPVAAVEGRVFGDPPGPVTRGAIAAYRRAVEAELGLTPAQLWG